MTVSARKMDRTSFEIDRTARRLAALNQQASANYTRALFVDVLAADLPAGYPDVLWRESLTLYDVRDHRFGIHTKQVGDRSISFEMLTSGRRNHEIIQLDKLDISADQTQELRTALLTWPQANTRTKKSRMDVGGTKYHAWGQYFVLVGYDRVRYAKYPTAAWKVQAHVLIPYGNAPISEAYFPRVVIEFAEQAILPGDGEAPALLADAVLHVASEVLSTLSTVMENSAEEDGSGHYPCHLDISVPAGCVAAADHLHAQLLVEDTQPLYWMGSVFSGDHAMEVMRVRISKGSLVDRPAPYVSTRASAPPAPTEPGDTFLLIESPLNSVTLTRHGLIQSTRMMQLAREFEDSYGVNPDNLLAEAGVDMQEVARIEEYDQVMSYLAEHAQACRDEAQYLVEAVQCQGLQAAARYQPVFRLLLDLATGFHAIEYGGPRTGLVAFLARATAPRGRMGKHPKRLKVSRILTKAHPELEIYANRHGIEITRPNSGADAGAKYVRQWNSLAEEIMYVASRSWWQPGPMMTCEVFGGEMERVSNWFCTEQYPDHLYEPYYLRCFLNTPGENRRRYLTWRESGSQ